ncbi:MAG: sugar phosphate isomerase/epimerase [Pseudomonadota bacterium]
MKYAVSNLAWSPEERLDAYRILEEAGITGLEIAPGLLFHAAQDPFVPEDAVAEAALAELADAGLILVSMQSLLFGVSGAGLFDGAEAREALVSGMERAIALAGRFDIPNLVFGSPKQRVVPDTMTTADALSEAVSVFRALGDVAAQAGTKIAIESNPALYGTNFLTTLEDAHAFVERVDHSAIVSILDLGAMHINGTYTTVPDRIPEIIKHLNHVHVSEPNLAPAPDCSEALVPVLQALQASNYEHAVSIEMARPSSGLADVKRAVDRLVAAINSVERTHA